MRRHCVGSEPKQAQNNPLRTTQMIDNEYSKKYLEGPAPAT